MNKSADSLDRDRRIDRLCDEFEAACLAGQVPLVQDYLDRTAEEDRADLAHELIPLDRHYRERGDERSNRVSRSTDISQSPTILSIGNYEVLQEIARGGMGVVFKGRDVDLRRDVAVKVLLAQHEHEAELIQRFVEEARISGQLQHPGIAPIYELGESADGRPYFAMKLVEGETLAGLLAVRNDPREGRERFLKIFEQICQTMAFAHSRGVIHRDLKPANIMVGSFGEVQVMDWGLAKVLTEESAAPLPLSEGTSTLTDQSGSSNESAGSNSHTRIGSILGTLAYMPPEQASGEIDQLDRRADVFALGAILCEILSGQPPYVAPSSEQVRRLAVEANLSPAFDRLHHCGADDELIDLAKRTLAVHRDARPADAGVLATELVNYRERVQTRLREAELAEARATTRAGAERTRRKLALVFSGAVAAVFTIGIIGTTWGLLRAERALKSETQQRGLADASARAAKVAADAESQAKRRLQRDLYVSDLQLAQQMWESSDGTASNVSKLLLSQIPVAPQPDLREFAWRLQWTQLHRNALVIKGHTQGAKLAAFTPDGNLFTMNGQIVLLHCNSLGEPQVEDARYQLNSRVSTWSISTDAKKVAIGTDNIVQVYDANADKIFVLTGSSLVLGLSFSADGRNLAAAWGDGQVQICDAATGDVSVNLIVDHPERFHFLQHIELTPDAKSLFLLNYPDDSQVTRLDTDRQESLCNTQHQSTVFSIAISSDGRWRATGDANGQVCLARKASPDSDNFSLRPHRGIVSALGFSADGTRLATGGADGMVTVWDVTARKQLHAFKGHQGLIRSVAFAADGVTITSASDDGTTRVWNELSDRRSRVFGAPEQPVFCLAYSPDGTRLAIGTGSNSDSPGGIVTLWEVKSGKQLHEFHAADGRVLSMAFSTDGRHLMTGGYDSIVRVWDVETGNKVRELPGLVADFSQNFRQSAVASLAVSPNGRFLAAGFGHPTFHQADYEQVVKVWELSTGRDLAALEGHTNTICDVAFSHDGKWLATVSDDHQLKLWSIDNWQLAGTIQGDDRLKCLTFSHDDQWIVAGDYNGTITIWETATSRRVNQLRGHADLVQRLVFSPDGRTLASASWDHTVKLWEPLSGRELRTLREHADWISCLAFSPDGNSLATGSFDATVRQWQAASAAEISASMQDDQRLADIQRAIQVDALKARQTRQAMPITAKHLDAYTGEYDNGITIAHGADHLTIQPVEGEAGAVVKLYPASPQQFFARDRQLDVTFLQDGLGKIVSVIIYRNGDAYEARRKLQP